MSGQDPWQEQFDARRQQRKDRDLADRTLVVDDEHLTVKPVIAPEVAFGLSDVRDQLNAQVERREAAAANNEPEPPWLLTDRDMVDAAETAIRACLEPDSLEAWKRLRNPDHPDPLTVLDIWDVAFRLVAKASGVPTGAPTGSSNGRAPTAPSSTAASPSPASPRPRSRSRRT